MHEGFHVSLLLLLVMHLLVEEVEDSDGSLRQTLLKEKSDPLPEGTKITNSFPTLLLESR